MDTPLSIDGPRLEARLVALGRYGKISPRGVNSLALSASNIQATIDVIAEMERLGLHVRIDPLGNVIALRPDRHGRIDGDVVLSGSHIDTVPTGGLYDGRLGVEATLEAFRRLDEEGIRTDYPMACVVFTAEEGARYQPAMIGSRYFCGLMEEAEALDVRSHITGDGSRLGDELEAFRAALREAHASGRLQCDYAQWERFDIRRVRSFVEMHIEQGPTMERAGVSVDAVQAVLGMSQRIVTLEAPSRTEATLAAFHVVHEVRQLALLHGGEQRGTVGVLEQQAASGETPRASHAVRYRIRGASAHAGGGIMELRQDAAFAASALIARARETAAAHGFSAKLALGEARIGLLDAEGGIRGIINVVPDAADFTLGLIGGTDAQWQALLAALNALSRELEAPKGQAAAGAHPGEQVTIETCLASPFAAPHRPHAVTLTVDQRNRFDDAIATVDAELETLFARLADQGVHVHSSRKQRNAPTPGHGFLNRLVREAKRACGYGPDMEVVLAANHDFNDVAAIDPATNPWASRRIPAAMISVACVGGVSHNVEELTLPADLQQGGDVLLRTLLTLADARTVIPEWDTPPLTRHSQTLEQDFPARSR